MNCAWKELILVHKIHPIFQQRAVATSLKRPLATLESRAAYLNQSVTKIALDAKCI